MASSTIGQLAPFLRTSATATPIPFATPQRIVQMGARNALSMVKQPGFETIDGHAYEEGEPVIRHITLLTQPPAAVVLYEMKTSLVTGEFSFPTLPPGNYMVIDSMIDNSRQALVYDWVVVP